MTKSEYEAKYEKPRAEVKQMLEMVECCRKTLFVSNLYEVSWLACRQRFLAEEKGRTYQYGRSPMLLTSFPLMSFKATVSK